MGQSLTLLKSWWDPQGRDGKLYQNSEFPPDRNLLFQRSLLTAQDKAEQSNFIADRNSKSFS